MIKSFSDQVVFVLLYSEPYLLTLAKTDYPSIFFIGHVINPLTSNQERPG